MKRILQLVSATVVTIALGFAPAVSAASSCNLGTTGPSSINTCTVNDNNTVTITCTNSAIVANNNTQSATSGTVTVNGNTVSGSATSGNANNVSAIATDLSQSCAAAPAVPTPTPTPAPTTPTPVAGGQGAGAVQSATTKKVAALPNTGPNTLLTTLVVSAASVGTLAALALVAMRSYRRRAFKV